MKDVLDAINTRIQSPYFGYAFLSFLGINWRELLQLFLADIEISQRISQFDSATDMTTLIIYPLLLGALFSVVTPWARLLFDYISQKPLHLREDIQITGEDRRLTRQRELEIKRDRLFDKREESAIQRAKRDEEVAAIEDENIRDKLRQEIEELRAERKTLEPEGQIGASSFDVISSPAREVLIAAAQADGSILSPKTLSGRSFQAGKSVFGKEGPRDFAKYESAIEDLERSGYIVARGHKREIFEMTSKAYDFIDSLKKKDDSN